MCQTLSIDEARKLVLLSQWLPRGAPGGKPPGGAAEATLAALRHLGYVQLDTISVVERAHHHTLWNRNRRYRPGHLDQLLRDKQIFEYWSHAAACLPMEDYRFSLPRMREFADGRHHWFQPDRRMMKLVRARIESEGPLRAQDFGPDPRPGGRAEMWDWKPAKRALEQLFMEGKLMCVQRRGFHKVYDLAERALPPGVDTTMPNKTEHGRFLISRFLRANGLGRPEEIAYQRPGAKPLVERCMAQMARSGEIMPLRVKGAGQTLTYHALPACLQLLERPLPRKRLKILSPFDNLLIQRKRMQHLFGFDYRIECYTPAAKRRYGYFSLPVLWGGKLVARMDCKADRPNRTLLIRNFVGEPGLRKKEQLVDALLAELAHFAEFNRCERVATQKLQDKTIHRLLHRGLRIRPAG